MNSGIVFGTDSEGSWAVSSDDNSVQNVTESVDEEENTVDRVFLLDTKEYELYLTAVDNNSMCLSEKSKEEYIEECANETGSKSIEDMRQLYSELENEYGQGLCNWWLREPGASVDFRSGQIGIAPFDSIAGCVRQFGSRSKSER